MAENLTYAKRLEKIARMIQAGMFTERFNFIVDVPRGTDLEPVTADVVRKAVLDKLNSLTDEELVTEFNTYSGPEEVENE